MFECKLDHLSSSTHPLTLKVDFDVIVDTEGVSRSQGMATSTGKVSIFSLHHVKTSNFLRPYC